MIFEFTVENFRSFGEAQTLRLIKGKEQNKPENFFAPVARFPSVVRTAAIFGHNASGKSNLVRAFQVFLNIIQFSAISLNPGGLIPGIEIYRLDPAWETRPCRFELAFAMRGRVFRYGFSAVSERIVAEKLEEELKSGDPRVLFQRHEQKVADAANVEFGNEFDRVAKENVPKLTRDNALILSSGANLNVPLLRDIHAFLSQNLRIASFQIGGAPPNYLAKSVQEDRLFRDQLIETIRDADIGINGFRVQTPAEPTIQDIEQLRQTLAPHHGDRAGEVALQFARSRRPVQLLSEHLRTDGKSIEFGFSDESLGTQLFAQLFWYIFQAVRDGATVVIDEFGSNIHPLLAEKLVALFQNPNNNNKNGAQFIFTTHHSQLMSRELFRKDQIWLMEKSPSGQTDLFSLGDFHRDKYTRSSEAFEKNYLVGRYGGIGSFGPTLSGRPLPATSPALGGSDG